MPSTVDERVLRYSQASSGAAHGRPLPADAPDAWAAVTGGTGLLGSAQVRDSARRRWTVESYRDGARGRFVVVKPVGGDNEPFRASADGYRPDAYLLIGDAEWTVLALLTAGHAGDEGRADEELREEAFRIVSRVVVEAQHEGLMGAAEDEDD